MGNIDLSKGGYVVLPVSEYNALITKIEQVNAAIKVRQWTYRDTEHLEVNIDQDWLHAVAIGKAAACHDIGTYDVKSPGDLYITSITLATRNVPLEEPTIEE